MVNPFFGKRIDSFKTNYTNEMYYFYPSKYIEMKLKFVWIGFFCLGFLSTVTGQNQLAEKDIKKQAKVIVKKYGILKADQDKVYAIQQNFLTNLTEIEPLRTTNPTLYLKKMAAIRSVTDGSIRRLVKENKRSAFDQYLLERTAQIEAIQFGNKSSYFEKAAWDSILALYLQ